MLNVSENLVHPIDHNTERRASVLNESFRDHGSRLKTKHTADQVSRHG